jgi:Holliday junction resolvase RusA-like endonuclease
MAGQPRFKWERVTMDVEYVFATRHRRDPDNYAGMMKGFIDGFVYAGLLTDDSFDVIQHLSFTARYSKADGPATIITVTRLDQE